LPDNFRFFVVNTSWLATTYCKWMGIINTCLDLDGEIWAASLGFFYGQDAPSFLVSVLWFSRFEFSYVSHEFTEKPSLNLSDIHRMRTQLQYIYIYIYIYIVGLKILSIERYQYRWEISKVRQTETTGFTS